MTICIAGKHRVAIECLKLVRKKSNLEVYACPVASDDGEDSWQPSFRKAARQQGVTICKLTDLQQFRNLIFLSLEYDKLLKASDFFDGRFLNVHFSLLPAYKGCYTSVWPLYFGERITGVSLHEIDTGIDTGPIIDQLEIPLDSKINARQLYEKYQDMGIKLVAKNIKQIILGNYCARRQSPEGSTYFSRDTLRNIDLELNFRSTASQINDKVRALYFPRYQTATYNGQGIASCEISNSRSTLKPGSVIQDTHATVIIATVDFDVILKRVERA